MNYLNKLKEPLRIKNCTIKNRTAMGPMGLVLFSDQFGGFNENAREYYVRRAQGGIGLIFTGVTAANYDEGADFALPCATYNPLMFSVSVKEMNERIHAYGSKIFLQITSGVGRSIMPHFAKVHIAPSEAPNRFDPQVTHRALTTEEVKKIIKDTVACAVVAKKSGFDGVEIHAVHEGYLLDQFAIAFFNQRTDEFGGSLEARLKMACDIAQGIKHFCGADFPVSLRYSVKSMMKGLRDGALPGENFTEVGKDMEEGLDAAEILVKAGYDMLNVDVGTYDSWFWNHPPMYHGKKGMYLEYARKVKERVDVPVVVSGRMDDAQAISDCFEHDCADMVSFARPVLADPDIANKILEDRWEDIRPCLSCHDGCMGRIGKGMPLSCAVNPECGREAYYALKPAQEAKHILVIGGGIAGMEFARVAASRGHKITLMEKSHRLGGVVNPGSVPSFKSSDRDLLDWYERQMKHPGIQIRLNTEATAADMNGSEYDAVVLCTGSQPVEPPFPVAERQVISAVDALEKKEPLGEKIVVLGAGLVGSELALMLAQEGKKVCLIERLPYICAGPEETPFMNWDMMNHLLPYNGVDLRLNTTIEKIDADGVHVDRQGAKEVVSGDTLINALGYKPFFPLEEAFIACGKEKHNIGDSRESANIMKAVWDAYEVARTI